MIFLTLLVLPLLVAGAAFVFLSGITWREFGLQLVAQLVVAGMSAAIVSCSNTADTEILNGRVSSKSRERVHCRHPYPCNCRPVSCGKNCRTTICSTCYFHSYDIDWDVHTTLERTITIATRDSQGLIEPARWTQVQQRDPVAVEHGYTNYIKAAPDSLFRHQGLVEKYAQGAAGYSDHDGLPQYPGEVFDYYRVNRFVTVGLTGPEPGEWNDAIAEASAVVGYKKQANLIVVLVRRPRDYFSALEQHWLGGKKNDVVLVVGTDGSLVPNWAEVMAWSTQPLVKIKIRDAVMALPALDPHSVVDIMRNEVQRYYRRQPMADFEYLAATATPTPLQWALSIIFGLAVAVGLAVFFHREEVA